MAANANDLFMEVGNPGTATTLSAPGYTAGGTTITVGSTSNWPTATGTIFAIDEAEVVDGKEVQIAGTYNEYEGVVSTGTSVTSVDWVRGVGDRSYSAGALTRVYIPVSAERENRLAQGMSVQHNQDGTHGAITATSGVFTGAVTASSFNVSGSGSGGGWDGVMSGTISAVTNNGNRSYDLTTSADNSALISPGMRLRTTRTVAAPTQSTSLNGTSQYFSKTTPAGMTFTDDFTVSAWVKLSSYQAGAIVSRYNGTSGWRMIIDGSGRVEVTGFASGAAFKQIISYQSIPLDKWVHITGVMDMSGWTTATNFIYIDGVAVPVQLTGAGTPTALIQAGNLEVGSQNAGGTFFSGKVAQVAVFSTALSQATIRGYMSQGLAGTETSLVSAYSFDGVTTDKNTTNANNLTANGSAVATNADSPFGGQAGGTTSSTLDYGIVQKVTTSTITVQVAEGCTIPTSGGVASASYSSLKNPYGFPGQRAKWSVEFIGRTQSSQSAAGLGVWYNIGSSQLSIPVGEWQMTYFVAAQYNSTAGSVAIRTTLSTSPSAESDSSMTMFSEGNSVSTLVGQMTRTNNISTAIATPHYLIMNMVAGVGTPTIYYRGEIAATIIRVENAYL